MTSHGRSVIGIFRDRTEAGRELARRLFPIYHGCRVRVFAVPRGGVPVAFEVAKKLRAPLDLIMPRKLPIPWNPEAGFGAVTADGGIVLDERTVREVGLQKEEIDEIAARARKEIERQAKVFEVSPLPPELKGQVAIVIDDGLASGYTMQAAVRLLRKSEPAEVVVALPVAFEQSAAALRPVVDRLEVIILSDQLPFAVANFYGNWYDVGDEEVKKLLARCREEGSRSSSRD